MKSLKKLAKLGACLLLSYQIATGVIPQKIYAHEESKTIALLLGNELDNDQQFIEWQNIHSVNRYLKDKDLKEKNTFIALDGNPELNDERATLITGKENKETNATCLNKEGLDKIFNNIQKTSKPEDTLILYFSGRIKKDKTGEEDSIGKNVDADYLKEELDKISYEKAIIVIDTRNADEFEKLKNERNIIAISGGTYLYSGFSSFGKLFLNNLSNSYADLDNNGHVEFSESFSASEKKHYNNMNSEYKDLYLSDRKILEPKIWMQKDGYLYKDIEIKEFNPNIIYDLFEKLSLIEYNVEQYIIDSYIIPFVNVEYASGVLFDWKGKEKFIKDHIEIYKEEYEKLYKEKITFEEYINNLYYSLDPPGAVAMCMMLTPDFGEGYRPAIIVFDDLFNGSATKTLDDARITIEDHEGRHAEDIFKGFKYKGLIINKENIEKLNKDVQRAIMELRAYENQLKAIDSKKWSGISKSLKQHVGDKFEGYYKAVQKFSEGTGIDAKICQEQLKRLEYELDEKGVIRKKIITQESSLPYQHL